jgi:hypothetical protein
MDRIGYGCLLWLLSGVFIFISFLGWFSTGLSCFTYAESPPPCDWWSLGHVLEIGIPLVIAVASIVWGSWWFVTGIGSRTRSPRTGVEVPSWEYQDLVIPLNIAITKRRFSSPLEKAAEEAEPIIRQHIDRAAQDGWQVIQSSDFISLSKRGFVSDERDGEGAINYVSATIRMERLARVDRPVAQSEGTRTDQIPAGGSSPSAG